ncbi:protein kinase, partial [Myxococcota bacterium]|nr:protein kinase [Myxococcota bacterium]
MFSACLIDDPARSADWARRSHGPDDASHAVKLIKPRLAQDTRYSTLLRSEAAAAIGFRHPSAVRIYEIGQVGQNVFLSLELVRGQTLAAVLQRAMADRRFLSPDLTLWIGGCLARVLALAHATPWYPGGEPGMLHGEVSPQSVLVTYDGELKLLGVGVGRSRLALPPARSRLPYRPPELFEKRRPDFTADIYGLGVVLYEALSGTRLFQRDSVQETTQAVLDHVVRPLHQIVPEVGPRISDLVARMIARVPSERPRTMGEVEQALLGNVSGEDRVYRSALAEQMRALFAEEMVDLPWVEFTPGFLDASSMAALAEEAMKLPGTEKAWRVGSGSTTGPGPSLVPSASMSGFEGPVRTPLPDVLGAPPLPRSHEPRGHEPQPTRSVSSSGPRPAREERPTPAAGTPFTGPAAKTPLP